MIFNACKSLFLVFCLMLQSCSIYSNKWERKPSSTMSFDSFKGQMSAFKVKIMGSESDSKCSPEQVDADFDRLMNSLKIDSCKNENFILDKEEFTNLQCPKIKVNGIFDRVVQDTIKSEKENLKFNQVNNADKELTTLYKEAVNFKYMMTGLLAKGDISADQAIDLVATYVENILFPMRDLVIIKRSYLSGEYSRDIYFQNLLLQIPESLLNELSEEQIAVLTQGPNPMGSPFYLELIPTNDSDYKLLNFSPSEIIRRDVMTLMKAPTSKNYILSLKWMTLHMMLSQVSLYDTLLGSKGHVSIPSSCQNHFNGNLPGELSFKVEPGVGEQFIENILAGHGLIFNENDTSYTDYYLDNINRDPTQEGYTGLVPFENYKIAKVNQREKKKGEEVAQLDDIAHFKSIINFKMHDLEAIYRGTLKGKSIIHAGYENFQKMMGSYSTDEVAEIPLPDGSVQSIYPGKQNLSPYILELMKEKHLTDYSELFSPQMKQQLQSKKIQLSFPSMYSSPAWRDWSLKILADIFYRYQDLGRDSELHRMIGNFCTWNKSILSPDFGGACKNPNSVKFISEILSEFRSGEKYIPTRRLEEKKLASIYPILRMVWNSLRDKTEVLSVAHPDEYTFLTEQMSAGNPWARLKVSYLIMQNELTQKKHSNKIQCDQNIINTELNKLTQIGSKLGLNLSLENNHAEKILKPEEKTYLWNSIIEEINQRNAQLFSAKSQNKNYYDILENLSYKTILNPTAAINSDVSLTAKTKEEIINIGTRPESQIGEFFLKLYSLRGHKDQQVELFEKFSSKNGIDNAFNLKLNFLALDESYKKPIYKQVLKEAALVRKSQILSQIGEFCSMNINDHKNFKNIFYSTTKAQNELNQMAGLPSIPPAVMDKINEMSPEEFRDMWWGIGSGVAGMAAIVVGGACTTFSGGICAPLGGTMAAMGLASLGIQVKLTTNEFERKLEADQNEQKVKTMEDLGFANIGSASEVHRSYAWTAFEAISILPLMGIASRSLAVGPKLAYVSTQSMLHKTGKESFKAVAKGAIQEEEVRLARYVLGVDSVSKNLGLEAASSKLNKIKKLYTTGAIDFDEMLKRSSRILSPFKNIKMAALKTLKKEVGTVVVKESPEMINKQTARVISNYFSDNPKEMHRLIHSYTGERLNRAVATMNELNAVSRIGNRIPIYSGVKDWFLRMRNESLAKNAQKILRIEKELKLLGSQKGQLEQFVTKNIDDLTDIFIDIPMRKRELPFIIQIQGLPEFSFYKGHKIPILSMMSEGQTMKKFFNARARLIYESYKGQARAVLKLPRFVQAETTYGAFKSFQLSIAQIANQNASPEAGKILLQYRHLEEEITQKLYTNYLNKGNKLEFSKFRELIFSPKNIKEEATSHAIWEALPADQLFAMKEVGELAHRAVAQLATYNDVDSFARYLSALKVLIINRNPAVLDLM